MPSLTDLVSRVADPALRAQLERETRRLLSGKKFGLVFEEHLPDAVALHGVPLRRGMAAAPRNGNPNDIWRVVETDGRKAVCVREGETGEAAPREFDCGDLVAVARFGEAIHPCLQKLGEVRRAPESDLWHVLVEADNYHALQFLEYLYPGQVDCIYIDPPYNTGARDWKYNNDYVDGNDAYRHSKWLSMMQKRLRLAKKLLNPRDSVLIVTIDEKECLHLGCLLEELFPEARIQMVTSVISAKGVVRPGQFSRVEEYLFFVALGEAMLTPSAFNMLDDGIKKDANRPIEWLGFRRRAPQARRETRPNQFYPVFVDNETGRITAIGNVVPHGISRESVPVPAGCTALWPLSQEGDERMWSLTPGPARANWAKGYLRVKNWDKDAKTGTVYYLPAGTIADIESGRAIATGRNGDGSLEAVYRAAGKTPPKRVWNMRSHNAETYGTNLLQGCLGDNLFSYPKSLYAVHDALRFFVADKPDALILDFFAGSGTTLHAVNLLNAEDGGRRRCILVTNNEVGEAEAKTLAARGLKPGDDAWEALGIARHVTWPRTVCSIEGHDADGKPLAGEYGVETDDWEEDADCAAVSRETGRPVRGKRYKKTKRPLYPALAGRKMADGFAANAAFFRLGFLDKDAVALGRAFREMLPTLWMKTGARGPCPELRGDPGDMLLLPGNGFAVLLEERGFAEFRARLEELPAIRTVFLVTDYEAAWRAMAKALPGRKAVQLYRDYLDNFRINRERT